MYVLHILINGIYKNERNRVLFTMKLNEMAPNMRQEPEIPLLT